MLRLLQAGIAGRAALRQASAIVCVTSPWLHGCGVLQRLGILHCPIIAVVIGPFDPAGSIKSRIKTVLRRWLDRPGHLIFLGEGDSAAYLQHVNPTPKSWRLVQFGVDHNFWAPIDGASEDGEQAAFSIGNAGRDYATLLAAWRCRPERLEIVTSLLDPQADHGPNIIVRRGIWNSSSISDADVRTFYQKARFIITPLKESTQPCGQSATLQAMACGKAVVLSRTKGLWDTTHMRHLENCYLVEPGDVAGLAAAIDFLSTRPEECQRIGRAARTTVEQHFTAAGFGAEIGRLIDSLHPPVPRSAERR
ncbi:MAG: glycosyltransferase family 4 protein [Hyphomicrobiaceae bacterium]